MGQTKEKALADLKHLLLSEKAWVKVHVAEFLLWEGCCRDEVKQEFVKEEQLYSHTPKYRIGIWRVLAQSALTPEERVMWERKIKAAYEDPKAEDRLHAIETLAKLRVPVVAQVDSSLEGSMRLYSLWNYALGGDANRKVVKKRILEDLFNKKLTDLELIVSSFVLRYLSPFTTKEYSALEAWVRNRQFLPSVASNLWATLVVLSPENVSDNKQVEINQMLFDFKEQEGSLNNILLAFAQRAGDREWENVLALYSLCKDKSSPTYHSDIHASAAYMMLRVANRLNLE
ncbi:type 1 periplasmic-binding domain-containing protein [Sphingobacterium faecale]|uniref:Uncharacterized protein n=1 Tax=Sphingobacterium faecale TaxID=2803775 RepID=A0ABS1R5X3_9SPHI|nr:hypothetical protein [Sphingobacterium faecale]MBL1409402.1 hypothetical protein [Sphingobacterium faecale]